MADTSKEAVPVAWGESYDGGAFFNTVSLTKTKHHTYPLYTNPPQPSETVAEAAEVLLGDSAAIKTLVNFQLRHSASASDKARSMRYVQVVAALRAMKGGA